MKRILSYIVICFVLTGCDNFVGNNPVPYQPVNISLDRRLEDLVNFIPSATTDYVIVNKTGCYYKSKQQHSAKIYYYGYAGVVIYVTNDQTYVSFDLCCPKCVDKNHPCTIDGIFAECPQCGECYDLSYGFGSPSKGICKYPLRRYSTFSSYPIITVTN